MRHYTAPPAASPQVSWESASHSCGTCLISSVIKINEVLIAVVTHANDCEAPRWGFPLPAANQRVNLGLDVWEIQQCHSNSLAAIKNDGWDLVEPLNVKAFLFWSDLCPTAFIYIREKLCDCVFFSARVFICQTQIILDNGSSSAIIIIKQNSLLVTKTMERKLENEFVIVHEWND